MKFKIKDFEKKLGQKLKQSFTSIGWDTAEVMGIGIVITDDEYIYIDWELIEFDKSDIDNVYRQLCEKSATLCKGKIDICVIEDTYLAFFGKFAQADVFKKLTRFGGIILANTINNKIEFKIIGAKSARSKLFKMDTKKYKGKSKEAVKDYLTSIGIEIDEDNCADGILLALLGIIEGMSFLPKTVKKTKKRRKRK